MNHKLIDQEMIKEYYLYLQIQKRAPKTITVYISQLHHFFRWLVSEEKELGDVDRHDLINFRDLMLEKGMKVTTVNKALSVLSSFFNWARNKGYITKNHAENLRILGQKGSSKPNWLTEKEEEQLLAYVSKERNPWKKARNEALIYLMLYAGLRIDEVSQLQNNSVHANTMIIYSQGQEKRKVAIEGRVSSKVDDWLKHRFMTHKTSPYLFITERSGKMQARSIQFVIEGYGKKLGFPLTSQRLRHTYCRSLTKQGIPLEQIMKMAGHKSKLTTYQYLE